MLVVNKAQILLRRLSPRNFPYLRSRAQASLNLWGRQLDS